MKKYKIKEFTEKKDYWTTREVSELIKEKYGVEYSQK
jgi:transposase